MKHNSPYPGLRPYREDEKDNFYGREKECDILIDKLLANRLTLLFAASGVGKSSLLNAAVIPELKSPTGKNLSVIYYNDWVANPLYTLRLAIIESLRITDVALPETTNNSLAELLRFYSIFCRHPLVLILDQFEEFFRYQRDSDEFSPLIKQLTLIILDDSLPVSVCISMREDFALELNAFKPELPTLLFENFFRLEKLSATATTLAILEPIKSVGYTFAVGLQEILLQDLLSRELDRNPNQPVSDTRIKTAEPPYLQIVCAQLWELDKDGPDKIIHKDTYVKAGKAQGLLKNYIAQELKKFSLTEKQIASRAFDHLISQRGTKMAYTAEVLADTLHIKEDKLQQVLKALSELRILRSQQREEKIWYELYHDMFSENLSEWNNHWKKKMLLRRSMLAIAGSTLAVVLFAGFDYWNNATHYHLRSKNSPEDRLEIYQGKLGSPDWFHQQKYLAESRYQRKHVEPDKCVIACDIFNYQELNTELIANLPLLERISAYAENGQFGEFAEKSGKLDKTAFALIDKTLKNKSRSQSVAAIERLGKIQINAVIPKMVYEWQENTSIVIQYSAGGSLPVVSTAALLHRKPVNEWVKSGNERVTNYLIQHTDWLRSEDEWQSLLTLIMDVAHPDLGMPRNMDSMFQMLIAVKGHNITFFLIEALENENSNVRRSAAKALGQLKSKEAIKILIESLQDEDSEVRYFAADALGSIKPKIAILPLIRALMDKKAYVQNT